MGGYSSPNVEWLGNIAIPEFGEEQPSAVVNGKHLYVTAGSALPTLIIYDLEDPERPREVGRLVVPGLERFTNVPDTNGSILVTAMEGPQSTTGPYLVVVDVSDKTTPTIQARIRSVSTRFNCVLACRWAFGGRGEIFSLADPSSPRPAGSWTAGIEFNETPGANTFNGLREVRKGILLTRTVPMYLLDARRDPTAPKVLARSDGRPYSRGWVDWPDGGRAGVILSHQGFHTESPTCEVELEGTGFDSGFQTWDATGWRESGLLLGIDIFRAKNGTFVDGDPAVSPPHGCVPSRFDSHPDFATTPLVAVAYHAHGVKLLEIDDRGAIEQIGFFLPYGHANYDGAFWVSNDIVLALSTRGLDILRIDTRSTE